MKNCIKRGQLVDIGEHWKQQQQKRNKKKNQKRKHVRIIEEKVVFLKENFGNKHAQV